ncbi:hypothetical protein GW7_08323 [Heterocephalus glaber]|uniref:Uncharacterized protein n=1 Tax=Heterocephalus glaber TaxID=10181 RepID=G5C6R3_HETGA|nr:hypothetical protein GW7_08323 [Heterocephalus glaber]
MTSWAQAPGLSQSLHHTPPPPFLCMNEKPPPKHEGTEYKRGSRTSGATVTTEQQCVKNCCSGMEQAKGDEGLSKYGARRS